MTPVIIDDQNPPKAVVLSNQQNQLQDDITKKLITWIRQAGCRPAAAARHRSDLPDHSALRDHPPSYNRATDPIGNGVQGWHNEGRPVPVPPTYYWAIVKTNDCGQPNTGLTFVNNFAQKVAHELAEQLVDRNGTFKELGDPCNDSARPTAAGGRKVLVGLGQRLHQRRPAAPCREASRLSTLQAHFRPGHGR